MSHGWNALCPSGSRWLELLAHRVTWSHADPQPARRSPRFTVRDAMSGVTGMDMPNLGKVLIADDDQNLRFILSAHLNNSGFEVLQAANGVEAVELAQDQTPDVIIMDVTMPQMDGMEATRRIKSDERTAHIPIIMLTARKGTDSLVMGLETGAQEYLAKPFEMTELLARVRTVYRLARTHRDLDRLNSDLEKEVMLKTRRLQLLYDYMRDLSQAETRDEILDLIINYIQASTDAQRISLLMADGTKEGLVCERALGIKPEVAQTIRVNTMEGIAGQVYRSGSTVVAKAMQTGGNSERNYMGEDFLSTPLVSTSLHTRDGALGVLNVTDRADQGPFSKEEIECIRSIADAGAIALHNVMRRVRLQQSVRVLLETVGYLAEYRDEETTLHLKRVSIFSRILGEELRDWGPYRDQISDEFLEYLIQAAPMHDIGKVGIPDDILLKPGRLTQEEFTIMKQHTEIGRRVLSRAFDPEYPVPLLQMCIDIAYCHHEHYAGGGYPRGLSGQDIPLAARIIALVDAYDAITSRRRYSEPRTHQQAMDIIAEESGRHFDPVLVEAFQRREAAFNAVREEFGDTGESAQKKPQPVLAGEG
jgi:response regulator RpfG family c-di-GMP phosphodiesterase